MIDFFDFEKYSKSMASVEPNDLILIMKENKLDEYRIQEQKK